MISQKEMLFMRGNAMSGAPIMIGTIQLAKPPISAGMTMKKIMISACAVVKTFEHLLAAVDGSVAFEAVDHGGQAVEDLDARLLQLGAHEDRQRAADDAREDREDQVQRADVLVVGREEPALKEGQRLVGVVMVVPVIVGMVMKGGRFARLFRPLGRAPPSNSVGRITVRRFQRRLRSWPRRRWKP